MFTVGSPTIIRPGRETGGVGSLFVSLGVTHVPRVCARPRIPNLQTMILQVSGYSRSLRVGGDRKAVAIQADEEESDFVQNLLFV